MHFYEQNILYTKSSYVIPNAALNMKHPGQQTNVAWTEHFGWRTVEEVTLSPMVNANEGNDNAFIMNKILHQMQLKMNP